MTTVQDVLEFLQTLAPQYMKMDWDNVGLLCGRPAIACRRPMPPDATPLSQRTSNITSFGTPRIWASIWWMPAISGRRIRYAFILRTNSGQHFRKSL